MWGYKSRMDMVIFCKYIPPKASKKVLVWVPPEEYDEDDVHEYVDKAMVTYCKEANKQVSITELLKPILQNQDKHRMETDMEQEVTLHLEDGEGLH